MKMTHLRIENFKGLHDITIPLSRFTCLIGENNAGKSSVLQALALFFSGSALPKTHYFDTEKQIRIEVIFKDIMDDDVNRLVEDHRIKI
ncbi:MAG: AAA family ATPase, partial [Deltaproteobacteria bacterium]|nr:AAA family ATPase [Deltaproteobacteria bacterium]